MLDTQGSSALFSYTNLTINSPPSSPRKIDKKSGALAEVDLNSATSGSEEEQPSTSAPRRRSNSSGAKLLNRPPTWKDIQKGLGRKTIMCLQVWEEDEEIPVGQYVGVQQRQQPPVVATYYEAQPEPYDPTGYGCYNVGYGVGQIALGYIEDDHLHGRAGGLPLRPGGPEHRIPSIQKASD